VAAAGKYDESEMVRILRAMIRELTLLPLSIKIAVAVALSINFYVITHWEFLTSKKPTVSHAKKVKSSAPPQGPFADFPKESHVDASKVAAIQAHVSKRMSRIVIDDPIVQPNGSITGNAQTIYLYEIKPFDSKTLCTRSSGERWACGLHAFASLRNAIAHKKIVCEPKKLLLNGVSAICRMGEIDIASILIRDGLAELDQTSDNAELMKAQALAKRSRLGIWDH
jgi:endonuclease YncB( thermonuclease family)